MKRLLKYPFYILLFSGLLFSMVAKSDIWETPKVKTYHSDNIRFKLIVTPNITSNQYYIWNYYKQNKHPQTKKILRQKEKFMRTVSAQDTILIPCTAELYEMNATDTVLMWKRTLLNNICPVYAIIANDGSSISTFDNWFSTGYGVNIFVVYDEKGNAKTTYKLEEFSPFPLNDYFTSISSIHWNKSSRYIDAERIEIVFVANDKREEIRIYNTKKLAFE